MTDEEKRQMWEELLDAIREPDRTDFPMPNIIAKEYGEEVGITRNAAYRRLERAFQDGRLSKSEKKALVDGRMYHVYWKKPLDVL